MDFFESQSVRRRESTLMLVAFAAVFITCSALLYWVAGLVSHPILAAFPILSPSIIKLLIIVPFVGVIANGSYRRWQDISAGSQQLANRLGAQTIERDAEYVANGRLINQVQEISIAAGIQSPDCFCLEQENSINAFVAGNTENTALFVTRGTLNELDEEEMRAVVAHEIGHIVNNDLDISMRLLIALGGLNAISEAGYACFKKTQYKRDHGYSRGNVDVGISSAAIAIVVGTFLIILGSFFSFFGNVLKAAFSRKREYLADAKAVQFTRNTWGLASALNKIAQSNTQNNMHSRYAGEIAHMCINAPALHSLFPKWLATHPPLDTRITKIEPHFSVKHRKRTRKQDTAARPSKPVARSKIQPEITNGQQSISIPNCTNELSVMLSLMIQTGGYKESTCRAKYKSIFKCYSNEPLPMREATEPGIDAEFEQALNTLLKLPATQRQNLLDHVTEIMNHDGIKMDTELKLLNHIHDRLNPPSKAA